jgi:hypothetical protein
VLSTPAETVNECAAPLSTVMTVDRGVLLARDPVISGAGFGRGWRRYGDIPHDCHEHREQRCLLRFASPTTAHEEADEGYEQADDPRPRKDSHGEESSGRERRHRPSPHRGHPAGAMLACPRSRSRVLVHAFSNQVNCYRFSQRTASAAEDRNTCLDRLALQKLLPGGPGESFARPPGPIAVALRS